MKVLEKEKQEEEKKIADLQRIPLSMTFEEMAGQRR